MKTLISLLAVVYSISIVFVEALPSDNNSVKDLKVSNAIEQSSDGFKRADCNYKGLHQALERDGELFKNKAQLSAQIRERKLIDFCRQLLESDIMTNLNQVDKVSKERASLVSDAIVCVDGGRFVNGKSFYMPIYNRSYQEGILISMAKFKINLSSLKSLSDFKEKYNESIIWACKTLVNHLGPSVRAYRVFSSADQMLTESSVLWSRNTEICNQLIDSGFEPFGSGAYRLLHNRLTAIRNTPCFHKRGIRKPFKKAPNKCDLDSSLANSVQ